MSRIGTPLKPSATKVMLLGSGELGKEVVIELQRLGVEVIAVDRYAQAPAMQVAHHSRVIDMLDGAALRDLIVREAPALIVPEIEAIATATLVEMERQGWRVIPTARAVHITMNREAIRRLAAEDLGLATSDYRFASSLTECRSAAREIGLPCLVKPVIGSSGKGQSLVQEMAAVEAAWQYAMTGGRGRADRVIVEGLVDFDYEITLLTLRHRGGTAFCEPVGHVQERGDYRESWQPCHLPVAVKQRAEAMAMQVTDALGGYGIFGVELFIRGDQVYFSEVSPRPHDTGMVTLISQELSEFALHARAILGLPVPAIRQLGPAASAVLLVQGQSADVSFDGLDSALEEPDTQLRLFGKPEVQGERRMGVALARDVSVEAAREKARRVAGAVRVTL